MRRVSTLSALDAGWGVLLLACGPAILRAVEQRRPDPSESLVARVLGARYLLQGCLLAVAPDLTGAATAVEMTHAASMVGLAAASRRHRRSAAGSAAVAAGLSAVWIAARRRCSS